MEKTTLPFGRAGKLFWCIAGLILLFGVAILDYVTGPKISFSIFYLIPIAIFTWIFGGRIGVISAFISAISWLIVEIRTNTPLDTFVYVWNTIIRLGFFLFPALFLRSLEREKAHARTDFLTGAINTRYFHELMERERERSLRYKRPFTVAFVDIDDFKTVNDTFGHTFGDSVLQMIAENIKSNLRKTDIVARVGGDEFAILLPETDVSPARKAISNSFEVLLNEMREKRLPVTFSVGVLTVSAPGISVDKILGIADKLMYSVKHTGKNNVKYASHTDEAS